MPPKVKCSNQEQPCPESTSISMQLEERPGNQGTKEPGNQGTRKQGTASRAFLPPPSSLRPSLRLLAAVCHLMVTPVASG